MPSEQDLLRAVIKHFDSDDPRWAYARWAETNGDPRAQLIGEQMTVAAFQRSHDAPAKWAINAKRANGLIEKHGALWRQPLEELELDRVISDLRFHRGFIEHVAISARAFASHASQIYELAPVRHLTLVDATEAPDVLASPLFARIASLAFAGSRIGDNEIEILAASPSSRRLHWLDLLAHHVTQKGVEAICGSPNLRALQYVNLSGNRVDDPIERYWYEGDEITHTSETELGRDLERRFGPQLWLHAPSRFGAAYPPLYEATVDP